MTGSSIFQEIITLGSAATAVLAILQLIGLAIATFRVVKGQLWWERLAWGFLGLGLIFAGTLTYQAYSERHAYPPPVLVLAQQKVVDGNGTEILGWRVRIDTRTVSSGAILVCGPDSTRTDSLITVLRGNGAVDTLDLRHVVGLEFKRPLSEGSALWGIRAARGRISEAKDLSLGEIRTPLHLYDLAGNRVNLTSVFEVHLQTALKLNGIAVAAEMVDSSRTVWLLGYDGYLYQWTVAFGDKILQDLGLLDGAPHSVVLSNPLDLAAAVYAHGQDSDGAEPLRKGWQGLTVVGGGGSKRRALADFDSVQFLATNGVSEQVTLLSLRRSPEGLSSPTILDVRELPHRGGWYEGSEIVPSHRGAARGGLLLTVDARESKVRAKLLGAAGRDDLNSSGQAELDIVADTEGSTYLEGVSLDEGRRPTVFVSDRAGFIYHRSLPVGWTTTPKSGSVRHYLDLSPAVTHGQDIEADPFGGVWIADEYYFRYVPPWLFSSRRAVLLWFADHAGWVWLVICLGFCWSAILGWIRPRKLQKTAALCLLAPLTLCVAAPTPAHAVELKIECEAIYLDLDGTAMDASGRVPKETVKAVDRFRACGGKIGIATGRTPDQARTALSMLRPDLPVVFFNGALATTADRSRVLLTETLPDSVVVQAVTLASGLTGVQGVILHTKAIAWEAIGGEGLDAFARQADIILSPPPLALDALRGDTTAMKLLVVSAADRATAIRDSLGATLQGRARVVRSGERTVEVIPEGTNKAAAIRAALQASGERLERIVTFGDSGNDVEMLREFSFGIAMENCIEEACRAGIGHTGSNRSDALARVIQDVLVGPRCWKYMPGSPK